MKFICILPILFVLWCRYVICFLKKTGDREFDKSLFVIFFSYAFYSYLIFLILIQMIIFVKSTCT